MRLRYVLISWPWAHRSWPVQARVHFASIKNRRRRKRIWGDAGWHIGSNLKSHPPSPPPCCGSHYLGPFVVFPLRDLYNNVSVDYISIFECCWCYMLGMNHWTFLKKFPGNWVSWSSRLMCCGNLFTKIFFGSYQLEKTWEKSIVLRKLFWIFVTRVLLVVEFKNIFHPGSKNPSETKTLQNYFCFSFFNKIEHPNL